MVVQLAVVLDFELAVLLGEVDDGCDPGEQEYLAAAESAA
jgi:hypothetical protein